MTNPADFTRTVRAMVAENDRVPEQRMPEPTVIRVYADESMTAEQVDALFDRIADAAHALDEPVVCAGSWDVSAAGERMGE